MSHNINFLSVFYWDDDDKAFSNDFIAHASKIRFCCATHFCLSIQNGRISADKLFKYVLNMACGPAERL